MLLYLLMCLLLLSKTGLKRLSPNPFSTSFLVHRHVPNLFRIKIFLCIAALPLSPEQALLSRHLLSRLLHKHPKRAKEQLQQETRRRRSQLMIGRRRMEEERRMRRMLWDQQQGGEKTRSRDDPYQQRGGGGVRRREDQDPSPVYPRRDQDPSPSIVYPQVSRQVMYPHFFSTYQTPLQQRALRYCSR